MQALQTSLLFPAHLLTQACGTTKGDAFHGRKGQPTETHLYLPLGKMGVESLCCQAPGCTGAKALYQTVILCRQPGSDQLLPLLPEENCLLLFFLSWAWKLIGVFIS